MADLVIAAANVVAFRGARVSDEVAGVAIAAGQQLARDATTRRMILAEVADDDDHTVEGMALNSAAAGQPVEVLQDGRVTVGAVLTVGTVYVASAAGAVAPVADLASGDYTTVLGVAETTSILRYRPLTAGVERP